LSIRSPLEQRHLSTDLLDLRLMSSQEAPPAERDNRDDWQAAGRHPEPHRPTTFLLRIRPMLHAYEPF
jgi:hypothetical protein